MAKPGISIFRKHILGPGETEHSGRGFYMMWHGLTQEQLLANLEAFIEKYKGKGKWVEEWPHPVNRRLRYTGRKMNDDITVVEIVERGEGYKSITIDVKGKRNGLSVPSTTANWIPHRSWSHPGVEGPICTSA